MIGTAHTIYGVLAVCKPLPVVYRLQANKRVVAPKKCAPRCFLPLAASLLERRVARRPCQSLVCYLHISIDAVCSGN